MDNKSLLKIEFEPIDKISIFFFELDMGNMTGKTFWGLNNF